jgi:hypothetical protein
MAGSPETLRPEVPVVTEHAEEFVVPETLQNSGIKYVPKTFKAQTKDDKGQPVIQTPPAQVITTVQPPSDTQTLTKESKGNITSSATWLAAFWLRVVKKALHFGWKVVGGTPPEASS